MKNETLDKVMSKINENWPLEKQNINDMSEFKASGMKFTVEQYYAKGLGNISIMHSRGFFGLMQMESVILNPFEFDAPLYSIDSMKAMGNDILILEIYDTMLEKNFSEDGVNRVYESAADLPDVKPEARWYDKLLIGKHFYKKGKHFGDRVDECVLAYTDAVLGEYKKAPHCDANAKKKKAAEYTEGLLSHGGAAVDAIMKSNGREMTEKLMRDVVCGTGS